MLDGVVVGLVSGSAYAIVAVCVVVLYLQLSRAQVGFQVQDLRSPSFIEVLMKLKQLSSDKKHGHSCERTCMVCRGTKLQ